MPWHCARLFGSALLLFFALPALAQAETIMHAGELAHALDRLARPARVLYVAAHPDDENTRLLAYLANHRHVEVAYLSLTRGGGGQNLIGAELGRLLEVIRTEELLAARRIDGARQFFTSLPDFGYSKNPDETFAIWGKERALAEVVAIVRRFQPDVILSRFNEEPPNHGHHTASAILAREAFFAAADPSRFPEQIEAGLAPWQARRLLYNHSTWRNEAIPEDALAVDVGGYDPRLGLGSAELAALSRSQHKSQGFGASGRRGEILEHFSHVAGERAEKDLLEGVPLTWDRYGEPGAEVGAALQRARELLARDTPEQALPALVEAYRHLESLEGPRMEEARGALTRILLAAAGVHASATAKRPQVVPGGSLPVEVELLVRRPVEAELRGLRWPDGAKEAKDQPFPTDKALRLSREVKVPTDRLPTSPHWFADGADASEPWGAADLSVTVELVVAGLPVEIPVPIAYRWTDRVHGERHQLVKVLPPITVTPLREAVLFPDGKANEVALRLRAGADGARGVLDFDLPPGWRVEPEALAVAFERAGEERIVRVRLQPPEGAESLEAAPGVRVDGNRWAWREDRIDYPHIPVHTVLQPARLRLVPLELRVPDGLVAYLPGAGDTILEDLAHVGVEVERIDTSVLREGRLDRFAAIVLGIRAYNALPELRGLHEILMGYVEAGGTVLVQYNTTSSWSPLEAEIGPFPLEIGDGRVTDQTARMHFVDPEHPALLRPNRIGAADFEGWVQERGLYFAKSWDERYQPLFSCADPGEDTQLGSTLVARHGDGRYVYTGLSFFRQLRAGVPGAYRLFINLIAGKDDDEQGRGRDHVLAD